MKLKQFKEMVKNLPTELDTLGVVCEEYTILLDYRKIRECLVFGGEP